MFVLQLISQYIPKKKKRKKKYTKAFVSFNHM